MIGSGIQHVPLCAQARTVIAGRDGPADVEPAVHAGGPELSYVLHRAVTGYHLRDALHTQRRLTPGGARTDQTMFRSVPQRQTPTESPALCI